MIDQNEQPTPSPSVERVYLYSLKYFGPNGLCGWAGLGPITFLSDFSRLTDLIPLGINEAFYDDHVKEISSGSTTTHSDSSLYDSFIFDLSINPFPPADRSDFCEFADELAHIISPPKYDCVCFKIEPNLGDFTMDVVEDTFPTKEPRVHYALTTHPIFQLNIDFILSSESLFAYFTAEEKKTRKIDHLAISLLIQGFRMSFILSLIATKLLKTYGMLLKGRCVVLRGSEYGEQDRKAAILYKYETFKAIEREQLLDTYLRYKAVMVTSDPLALVAEKIKVSKRKEKVVVSSDSEGNGADDFSELKKITALSSTSHSANKKQEFVKSDDKKVEKKDDEKKRDMSKVKCYNCKKEGHFAKDCKKANVKYYKYYKTKMLLAKKDSDEQVLLAEDQAWMESSSDSDQEINANMVFMAQIKKVLSELDESSSSIEETIAEVAYYTFESESEFEFVTSEYYDNSINYGLFVNNDD
nr:hypothetical protein [Tanacetum cinerariifolium]